MIHDDEETPDLDRVRALVLAGGASARLFPVNKVFAALTGDGRSMVRAALERVAAARDYEPWGRFLCPEQFFVVTSLDARERMRAELALPAQNVLAEPERRNTLPAILWALARIRLEEPHALVAILTADHVIGPEQEFRAVLADAVELARARPAVVTIGVAPGSDPDEWTSFGAARAATAAAVAAAAAAGSAPGGARPLDAFEEKPTRERACAMLAEGGWLWNSGMFVFRIEVFEKALGALHPAAAAVYASLVESFAVGNHEAALRHFAKLRPRIPHPSRPDSDADHSIDFALMMPLVRRRDCEVEPWVIPARFSWTDVGNWDALGKVVAADACGNVTVGDVRARGVSGSVLVAERGRAVEAEDVSDLVVVVGENDRVLVTRRRLAPGIKAVVARAHEAAAASAVFLECARCLVEADAARVALYGVEGLEISVAAGRVRVRPLREGAGEAVLLDRLGERVQALQPCVNHYAWGGDVLPALLGRSRGEPAQPTAEAWLTSTQKDGPVALVATPLTLAEWVSERPEILGPWSRAIFGDRSPVFLKFLSTRFPPRVHMGFDPAAVAALGPGGVEFPALFRSWLEREQELLRELFAALDTARLRTAERFDRFRSVYEHWAVEQSLAGWRHGAADAGFVARLAPFLAAGAEPPRLEALVRRLRENRARTVALFNEVSLEEEVGNALLSPAGMPHAIFGLSHQGHPRDHAAARLRELFAELAARRAAGAAEAELLERARAVRPELDELRAANRDDPKSEAWIPFRAGGEVLIAEPQQTSNCTYSWLDLYTPFVFRDGRTLFRKGDPARGVAPEALDEFLAELDFEPAAVESFRCRPRELGLTAPHRAARLYAVVDDGVVWPYFTAHRLELGGRPREPASFRGDHPRGAFQEIVVLAGSATVTSGSAGCRTLLAPGVPAFVPATLEGGYTLESEEEATLLLVSVPRPGGSSPVA